MPNDVFRTDPVLDELHAIRRQMLAECGGSLEKLVERIQQEEAASNRVFARVPEKPQVGIDRAKAEK